MAAQETDVNINPADETIVLGPLAVRFLITGDDANGSLALFELTVPAAQRLAAPAHSHNHYEETIYGIEGVLTWTVDDKRIDVGPGRPSAFRAAPSTGSTTPAARTRRRSASSRPPPSVRSIFAKLRGAQCGRRRAAGPRQDGRHHAPPRPYAGALTPHVEPPQV